MHREEFLEEGIVEKVEADFALIRLGESKSCETCGARMVCSPGGSGSRSLLARAPIGVQPGDRVQVLVTGRSVLAAASLLYGVPLLLFVGGIFAGLRWFTVNPELWSSLLGIGLVAVYGFGLWFLSRTNNQQSHLSPTIVSKLSSKES
ncbi:MAG: SoxR reducing system RseC family protein [Anaerolineaceae bacterium]|nr:SoxR reducing system RseC family protein [Anaerolineaceae bacterium]